ncbi:hypothetical protein MNBD_ALPHA05-2549 [hydrothermal vent metagenome]|uniref:Lipopolysaccharide export system protein LptC n=1 Tax=hydrothermal vent metagenome TaxID=652676 RepID=A0A3B0SNE7_9ZZZZ
MTAADTSQLGDTAQGQPPPRRKRLESLPTRARTTGQSAAARSRLIKRLRVALPTLAVILIGAFIFNTQSNQVDDAFLQDFEDIAAATDELRMANPRFAGVDGGGNPFEITALSAKQDPARQDVVELDRPRAIQGAADEKTTVTAQHGVYQSDANILELTDGVRVEHELAAGTFVLRAPGATVQIKDQTVASNAGVGGEGPDGETLKADRMMVFNAEKRIVFEGNVSMRIYPNSARDLQKPEDSVAAEQKKPKDEKI